jgi:hypothetical protein
VRPDVHPAGGRPAGAAFRIAEKTGGAARPAGAEHGHERGFRGRGGAGGDVYTAGDGGVWGEGVATVERAENGVFARRPRRAGHNIRVITIITES